VCSSDLDAFEQYLFTQGREWERYAWLKGRIMPAKAFADSDTSATIHHVESMRVPFVYRKYFDFDALAALRDLRERIRQDWQKRVLSRTGVDTQHNIKLGDGGIREIEFVVQLNQLIRGGKMPALQQRGLLLALNAQCRAGLIPEETAQMLAEAYIFLRRVEHALQYREDAQTHLLPQEPELRAGLAYALQMTPGPFESTLATYRKQVEGAFRDAFRLAGLAPGEQAQSTLIPIDTSSASSHQGAQATLDALFSGFLKDSETIETRVKAFLQSHRIRGLSPQSRRRVDELVPLLLQSALATEHPSTAALRLLDLIETIAQRSAYLALLAEFPETLKRVARLMAASPWAAQ
jgi:glutamate-ammonia-ligase adenylyltransferase